ncbi:hypothetical protein CLOM_g10078 [Closterium sp. NIES-68]|nr:hypothetical protein CLOM_g10078 [Closterium sp. NIES-68]
MSTARNDASNDIDMLNKLHESMDECRLKLDIQYYVDLAGADLWHLLSGPEPEMRVIENWQTEGFNKGREFRLVSEQEDAACMGKAQCRFLCGMTLDKHMVRYLLEVDTSHVGHYSESPSTDVNWK